MLNFIKDFLIYGFASVLGKIAAVFLMPIYTSILSREEYGAMAMLISVKGIIDLVSNLNIHSGIARDYYEDGIDRKVLVSTGMWSILSLSLLIMAILLLSKAFWLESVLELSDYSSCFILLLISVPTGSLMSYFAILTRFQKKPILFSIGTLIGLVLQLSIAIYTIVFLRMGIVGFFVATLVSEMFSISYYAYINREYISFDFRCYYLKRALIFSLPLLPAILSGWIDSSLGQIIVGKYISLTDLGVYSIALQLASIFALIGTALNNVWTPFLYENYQKNGFSMEVNRLFLMFIIVLSVVSCSLSLLSKEIILLLSNFKYLKATLYLTLLCLPMSIYLLFPIANSGISISRDTKYTGLSYVIGSLINILFLILLLPKIGIYSIPLGLTISRLTTFLFMCYITKLKGFLQLHSVYLIVLFAIVIVCFYSVYSEFDLIIRIALLLILNGSLMYWANRKFSIIKLLQCRFRR